MTGGLALATKVSSASFFVIPVVTLFWQGLYQIEKRKILQLFFALIRFSCIAIIFFILFSPYNILALNDFLGALRYETDVATGKYVAFYTRQFVGSLPVIFQFKKIFPYTLGLPVVVFFSLGMIFLPWRKEYNLLRIGFVGYFLPSAFLFTKWTRFMSPLFPIMLIIAAVFLFNFGFWAYNLLFSIFDSKKFVFRKLIVYLFFAGFTFWSILPGMAYLNIYQQDDVRFIASSWIFKNVSNYALILSETANVVDLPITYPNQPESLYQGKSYRYISFNFYDVDADHVLALDLKRYLKTADYILIPSRRVFMNHTCYLPGSFDKGLIYYQPDGYRDDECLRRSKSYPVLNSYYKEIFSGTADFVPMAEFVSYPEIRLFGQTLISFRDEEAEESWSVFDHPVIRLYKRVNLNAY